MDLLDHLWQLSGCTSLDQVSFAQVRCLLENTGYNPDAFTIFTTWLNLQTPALVSENRKHIIAVHMEYLKRRLHDYKAGTRRQLLRQFFEGVRSNPFELFSPPIVESVERYLVVGVS